MFSVRSKTDVVYIHNTETNLCISYASTRFSMMKVKELKTP